MAEFHFGVREVTIRHAIVEAPNLKAARSLLREWIAHNRPELCGERPPMILSDLETVSITFRRTAQPTQGASDDQ